MDVKVIISLSYRAWSGSYNVRSFVVPWLYDDFTQLQGRASNGIEVGEYPTSTLNGVTP